MSPQRRRLVVALVAGLAVGALALTLVVLLSGRGGADRALPPQDRPGPVVLVPGYGGGTGSLRVLADRLAAAGRSTTVVELPGDGTGDLEAQAAALDATVSRVLARSGAPSVDLVGYSAGGVVVRLWAREHDGAHRARRIVTLGSPHHGAALAALAQIFAAGACPAACQELAPGSPLLRRLNRGDETPDGPVWVSLWTEADQTVQPPDSARLAGALDVPLQRVCADTTVGHSGLPRDPLVAGLVLRALGVPAPAPPVPGDCAVLRAAGASS